MLRFELDICRCLVVRDGRDILVGCRLVVRLQLVQGFYRIG